MPQPVAVKPPEAVVPPAPPAPAPVAPITTATRNGQRCNDPCGAGTHHRRHRRRNRLQRRTCRAQGDVAQARSAGTGDAGAESPAQVGDHRGKQGAFAGTGNARRRPPCRRRAGAHAGAVRRTPGSRFSRMSRSCRSCFTSIRRNPKDRLVGINDRMLREGDSVEPGLVLEQITPDGMILSYKGYRFLHGSR